MPGEVAWSKINVTHGGQALSLHNSFVLPKEQRTELAGRDVQYTVNGGVCSICKSNSVQKREKILCNVNLDSPLAVVIDV